MKMHTIYVRIYCIKFTSYRTNAPDCKAAFPGSNPALLRPV